MSELKSYQTIQTPSAKVLAVAINDDKSRCAAGDRDGMIHIIDTASGEVLRKLKQHVEFVYCLAFMPNGHLLSAGKDKSIREWDIETGEFLCDYAGIFQTKKSRSMAAQSLRAEARSHSMTILSLAVTDDNQMATSSQDKLVKLWKDGNPIRTCDWHTGPVTCVRFQPETNILYSASRDKTIRSWSPSNGAVLHRYNGHLGEIIGLEFIDESSFVSVDVLGNVLIWDADIEQPAGQLYAASGRVMCASLLRKHHQLLLGLENGSIEAVDIRFEDRPELRQATAKASQHTSEVRCIAATDDDLFASSDNSGKVILWHYIG